MAYHNGQTNTHNLAYCTRTEGRTDYPLRKCYVSFQAFHSSITYINTAEWGKQTEKYIYAFQQVLWTS